MKAKAAQRSSNLKKPNRGALAALPLLLIPLTIFVGMHWLGDRKFYFISLLIVLEALLPFFFAFEGSRPKARELVTIAVLCALAVAGRAAFFMIPQVKPMAAVVILAGAAFGGGAGFLVGAVSAFVSNLFFGQGPWTPWQMFAFGLIGFFSGLLFRRPARRPRARRLALCAYGGLSVMIIYGLLMDTQSALMLSEPSWPLMAAAWLRGLSFNLAHALSTVFFLAVMARPMLEKIDRLKLKYGMLAG